MTQTLDSSAPPAADRAPFARLRIGLKTFDIAELGPPEGLLCFREAGKSRWIALRVGIEDGWHRIGGDILMADPAAMTHFLHTHAVRLHGWFGAGQRIAFDTLGTPWSVDCPDAIRARIAFADEPEVELPQSRATADDPRDRAIQLLIAAIPGLRARFGAGVEDWARRLAAGASVAPIL